MTTEPKFIPENAVCVQLDDTSKLNVRLIDCVGYIVPSSLGYIEGDNPRMVATPWFEDAIPFNMAAEIGTRKVINEHSTIGLVITTDGSISEIPREEYAEAEERVIGELKAINKPFAVLLNCMDAKSNASITLAENLSKKYGVPVVAVNCLDLNENDIKTILSKILYEFPIKEVKVGYPAWINSLSTNHWLRKDILESVKGSLPKLARIRDVSFLEQTLSDNANLESVNLKEIDLGRGKIEISLEINKKLFYKIVAESTDFNITGDSELLACLNELSIMKKEYLRVKNALDEVEATGYGIVMPSIEELSLEEPEIMKQGGRYGVRLKASAPSIHMMKANITTEVSPIVGSERQSEDLIMYLLNEFQDDPVKIWDSNIFGKSLHSLVNEGLHTKLSRMPHDARMRIQETLERVINEGCNGLVCIII